MSMVAAVLAGGTGLLALPPRPAPGDRLRIVTGAASRPSRLAGKRWRGAGIAALVPAAFAFLGPVLTVGAVLAVGVGRHAVKTVIGRREARRQEHVLLEAVSALAAEVRSGRPPAAALAVAAESASGMVGQVLGDAAGAATYGAEAGALLTAAGRTAITPAVRSGLVRLGAAWTVSARSGAAWSDVLDQVERELRAQESHRQRMSAELAGSRATAVLLAGLPVVGLLLGGTLGADPVHVLMHTRGGQSALAAGLALEAAGLMWTARIIRSAQDNR